MYFDFNVIYFLTKRVSGLGCVTFQSLCVTAIYIVTDTVHKVAFLAHGCDVVTSLHQLKQPVLQNVVIYMTSFITCYFYLNCNGRVNRVAEPFSTSR
jgi:hypothetical protein